MRNFSIFLCLFLSIVFTAYAQNETETKQQPAGPPMEIVKDIISLDVDEKGLMVQTEDEIIKILTQEGVNKYSQIIRFYNSDFSNMEVTKALYTKTDGTKIDVSSSVKDTIFPMFGEESIYKSLRAVIIDFTGIEPESSIEYAVIRTDKLSYKNGAFWETSISNDLGLIKETSTVLNIPKGIKFNYFTPGHKDSKVKPSSKKAKEQEKYEWKFKNVPPLTREVAMPPIQNVMSKVIVSSMSSWNELADMVNDLSKPNMECSDEMKAYLNDLSLDSTKADLFKKIYESISKKMKVLPLSYGMAGYTFNKAADIYSSPVTTSWDAGLLLVALYRAAGFDANLAMVSSLEYGNIYKEIPSPLQFDTILVTVKGITDGYLWLDPSSSAGFMNKLPLNYQGRPAFIIGENSNEFATTPILSPQQNREELVSEIRLTADGSAEVVVKMDLFGTSGISWKELYDKLNDNQRENLAKVIAGRINQRNTVLEKNIALPKNGDGPFSLYTRFIIYNMFEPQSDSTNSTVSCSLPILASGDVRKSISENISNRKYPVFIGAPIQEDRRFHIMLPNNIKVVSLPKKIHIDNKIASYQVLCEKNEKGIYYFSRLILKTVFVDINDIGLLRDVLDSAEKAKQEKLVFTNTALKK